MASVDLLDQGHLPKGSSPNDLETLEVLLAQARPPKPQELGLLLSVNTSVLFPLVMCVCNRGNMCRATEATCVVQQRQHVLLVLCNVLLCLF